MSHLIAEQNLALIAARWPVILKSLEQCSVDELIVERQVKTLVVNNIQLTTNYEPAVEAMLQAQRIPVDALVANIYGTGIGELQDVLLILFYEKIRHDRRQLVLPYS